MGNILDRLFTFQSKVYRVPRNTIIFIIDSYCKSNLLHQSKEYQSFLKSVPVSTNYCYDSQNITAVTTDFRQSHISIAKHCKLTCDSSFANLLEIALDSSQFSLLKQVVEIK